MTALTEPWAWAIAAAVLAGLEVVSPGAFMIWLAGAAAVTAVLTAVAGPPLIVQAVAFVSFGAVAVTAARRWFARPRVPADTALNQRAARMAGSLVTVVEPLLGGRGRVQVGDSPWSATGPDMPVGAVAKVVRVDGTTLVVTPIAS